MNLEIQIQSITASFIYGFFSSLIFNLTYFLLYSKNLFVKMIFNMIYVICIFLLFFFVLFLINNGVVHIYFIILFIGGFVIGNYNFKKIRIINKKS